MPKFLKRTLVILFWVGLIFLSLYWPKLKFIAYETNSITVFAWGDIIDPQVVADFEKETGIKVRMNYYSSNEELLVKLKATKGLGYDLIIPSDYAVELLTQENLLKEIDKTKLRFWNTLNPILLNHSFDPNNRYSIPFSWEIYLFGLDKGYFQGKHFKPSWKAIFNPAAMDYKISMINDPIDAVQFCSFYLFGYQRSLTAAQTEQIKQTLIQQKQKVEAYASFRGDYFLATKNCPLVLASSSYILRSMKKFPFITFAVPKEGTFITIESLALPTTTTKDPLIYQFINFLFRPDSIKQHHETFGFFPSSLEAIHLIDWNPETKELLLTSTDRFKEFHFTRPLLPQRQLNDLWVEVKTEAIE